jgi:regulator of replication initiation timing
LELKQLQSIFEELNLKECFGSVLEDNTRLLLEVKQEVEKISDTVKEDVKEAITDTVKPIALKKTKAKPKTETDTLDK